MTGPAPGESALLAERSAGRIRGDAERIVTEIPYRAAGSAKRRRLAEYSRDAMLAAGLSDVLIHELPAAVPRRALEDQMRR
jgi:hypothetical protein